MDVYTCRNGKKRKEDLEPILSDRGIQLRMNRGIQVEGSVAT